MSLPFEALLVLGIPAFYVFDSALLLCFNELVFQESFGKWAFSTSGASWQMGGKSLYLPNPLTPYKTLFRVAWSPKDPPLPAETDNRLLHLVKTTRPLTFLVSAMAFEMLVLIPVVIFAFGTGPIFLSVLALTYLTIIFALRFVYVKRADLQLSRKELIGIFIDSLACPPFALNMLRKVTLNKAEQINPVEYARLHLKEKEIAGLAAEIRSRVSEKLDYLDEGEDANALRLYDAQLSELMK